MGLQDRALFTPDVIRRLELAVSATRRLAQGAERERAMAGRVLNHILDLLDQKWEAAAAAPRAPRPPSSDDAGDPLARAFETLAELEFSLREGDLAHIGGESLRQRTAHVLALARMTLAPLRV